MSDASRLAAAERGSVIAAAGCGKTELIALAVAESCGRQLVLTHTNAGVEALLRRMRRFGISRDHVSVDTIHGWSIKYLTSYPKTSGDLPIQDAGVIWGQVCPRMTTFARTQMVREIVRASYAGVYVDEYQDCTPDQHALIVTLAQLVPVRVLGDPLQGVFRFAGAPPPWDSAVEKEFPNVATLTKPWRWDRPEANPELGEWLTEARSVLQSGGRLGLQDPRLHYVQTPGYQDWGDAAQACCFEIGQTDGTTAALLKWPSGYRNIGRITGGFFQCVEPIDAKDGVPVLRRLEQAEPEERRGILLAFLRSIASRAEEHIASVAELVLQDAPPTGLSEALASAVTLARADPLLEAPARAAELLDAVGRSPEIKIFRWELLRALIDALLDADNAGYTDLVGHLRKRRSLTSHTGRRLSRRVAGSTLLLKGMEFDHAIVVHTGEFSIHDLYVALTRGAKSLTVLSPTPEIDVSSLPSA